MANFQSVNTLPMLGVRSWLGTLGVEIYLGEHLFYKNPKCAAKGVKPRAVLRGVRSWLTPLLANESIMVITIF